LIVKTPGSRSGGSVVDGLVASIDVAPTILRSAGVAIPKEMQGVPLPLDGSAPPSRLSVFAEEDLEGNVLQAVRTPSWKLITANPGNPRGLAPEELYDLSSDPGETRELSGRDRGKLEEMRAALGAKYLEAKAFAGAGADTEVDDVTKDRLKALGYLD